MKLRKTQAYDSFSCLAGSCPHTCCQGWKIHIDQETSALYGSLKGEFGREVKNSIDWMEECFLQNRQGCLNLRKDGLCRIQCQLGEAALCDTCRSFPRHVEEYPGLREYSLSMSCPAVVLGIMEKASIGPDIESESEEEDDLLYEDFDPDLFAGLLERREELRLMAARASDWDKCRDEVLQAIRPEKQEQAQPFWSRKRRQTWEFLQSLFPVDSAWSVKLKSYIRQMKLPELSDERSFEAVWCEYLQEMRKMSIPCGSFDQLLVSIYWSFLSVSLPGAAYDGEAEGKILLALFFADWIREILFLEWYGKGKELTAEDIVCLTAMFDRQVEHDDENLIGLEEWLVG